MYEAIASVFDQWMEHMDYAAIHGRLMELLGADPKDRRVLDVCTGTGTIPIELARSGVLVIGLDQSAEMIEIAEQKLREAEVGDRVSIRGCNVVGDDDWPEGPFDLILCVGDSVNYFDADQLRRFVERSSAALSPSGTLYFDINSVYKLRDVFGNSLYAEELAGWSYIWRNRLAEDQATIDFDITIFKQNSESPDCWTRHTERHTQYVHTLESITRSLRRSGLDQISVAADFSGKEQPVADTWRWVIEARRSATGDQ
jgi:cyclopropane fatty-acyl-phospholipid synthase-like methyltransferase